MYNATLDSETSSSSEDSSSGESDGDREEVLHAACKWTKSTADSVMSSLRGLSLGLPPLNNATKSTPVPVDVSGVRDTALQAYLRRAETELYGPATGRIDTSDRALRSVDIQNVPIAGSGPPLLTGHQLLANLHDSAIFGSGGQAEEADLKLARMPDARAGHSVSRSPREFVHEVPETLQWFAGRHGVQSTHRTGYVYNDQPVFDRRD